MFSTTRKSLTVCAAVVSMWGTMLMAPHAAFAQGSESGQVTTDALLLSYVASPLGSTGSATNTYTKSNATTLRLTASSNTSLTLSSSVGTNNPVFNVGSQTTFRQSDSTSVARAITIRRSIDDSTTTAAPGSIENTLWLGVLKPQLQFDGSTTALLFRFLQTNNRFALNRADLTSGAGGNIKPSTSTSFQSQYITDPALLGSSSRFKLRQSILQSANATKVYTFTKATGGSFSTTKSATNSVEIVTTVGFTSPIIKSTFSVGAKIDFMVANTQEFTTDKIITSKTTLQRNALGTWEIYWDRAYKTLVVIDRGAPTSGTYATGYVTDSGGNPVPNAFVRVTYNNVEYSALTDGSGYYAVKGVQTLPAGTYQVLCGTDTVATSLGGRADFLNAVPSVAQDGTINGELYNSN